MSFFVKSIALVCFSVSLTSYAGGNADPAKVGSTLNKKVEINVADIPADVLSVVMEAQPDFTIKEVEKEFKHGKTYFDIEGEKADGSEIEFDLLLVGDTWKIMEIQRDLTLHQCPKEVVAAYQEKTNFSPQRIIESKQTSGEVIYEFYSTLTNGKEVKHEVKFHQGKAEVLETEWEH